MACAAAVRTCAAYKCACDRASAWLRLQDRFMYLTCLAIAVVPFYIPEAPWTLLTGLAILHEGHGVQMECSRAKTVEILEQQLRDLDDVKRTTEEELKASSLHAAIGQSNQQTAWDGPGIRLEPTLCVSVHQP